MAPNAKSSPYRGVTLFRPTMKWRAQISANGKTTSLGDHDTEELAATAFDRAAIHRAGQKAKTNFPIARYADEIEDLEGMDLVTLVAMLRTKARKSGTQTSHFRGVSLLKQTQRWHAQINVGGKQVHLGFFPTEEYAARSYDRAAINKGAKEVCGKIVTNFDVGDYTEELDILCRISQEDLVFALSTERFAPRGRFEQDRAAVQELLDKAERAQPKSTIRKPLYQDFGQTKALGNNRSGEEDADFWVKGPAVPRSQRSDRSQAKGPAGFDRLFSGLRLTSLDNGPLLELPLLHPLTGAPFKVSGPVRITEKDLVKAYGHPVRLGSTVRQKPPANPSSRHAAPPSQHEAGSSTRIPREPKLAEPHLPAHYGMARDASSRHPEDGSRSSDTVSREQGDSGHCERLDAAHSMQQYMAALQRGPTQFHQPAHHLPGPVTPPVSPMQPSANRLTASFPADQSRTAKRPRAPITQPSHCQVEQGDSTSSGGASKEMPYHSPKRVPVESREAGSPALKLSPVTPQPRSRAGWSIPQMPGVLLRDSLADRLSHLQRSPQSGDERHPEPAPVHSPPAKPLTKRQEALAIRKTEEAAKTLAAKLAPEEDRRAAALPEEVGEALMDFAEAAEIAEWEDRQEEEINKRQNGQSAILPQRKSASSTEWEKVRSDQGEWVFMQSEVGRDHST